MRGFYYLAVIATALTFSSQANAQIKKDADKPERIDSVVVSASRAGKYTPVTYSMVGKKELRKANPMNSLPMILGNLPSVISQNEGGTGLGYSKFSVRGVSGSQINVTLNGITLNDPESQEVFWVNIPALSSILSSVQLQRGLGTSSNGPGAFGASLNMNTALVPLHPSAHIEFANGSYGTLSTVVSASTGLTKSGLYASAAYSKGYTDGYIHNAYARVQSAYATIGYLSGNQSLRFTWLMGNQHTGLTWNGISLAEMKANRRANGIGAYSIKDKDGNIIKGTYPNETDNYTQNHFQFNYTLAFNHNLSWSTTYNYTPGYGYYEQFKHKGFGKYNMKSIVADSIKGVKSYFATRKFLKSNYHVITSNLVFKSHELNFNTGFYLSHFDNRHYGDVISNSLLGESFDYAKHNPWYLNKAYKNEINLFGKVEYRPIDALTLYLDLQYRGIWLTMKGLDDDQSDLGFYKRWNLFNPRLGFSYNFLNNNTLYASFSLGHREPGREDLKQNIIFYHSSNKNNTAKELVPETLYDIEFGYRYTSQNFVASANLYFMEYRNMLLETGKVSPTGYLIKSNSGSGYRRGLELSAIYTPCKFFSIDGNLSLSTNKLKDYKYLYQAHDENWNNSEVKSISFKNTTMLLSPSIVGFAKINLYPFKELCECSDLSNFNLSLSGKYVGSQYWDNTQSKDRRIPAYFVMNASVNQEFKLNKLGTLGFSFFINNLLNTKYYSNAWVYRNFNTTTNSWYQEEGVFPQAPINFMFKTYFNF